MEDVSVVHTYPVFLGLELTPAVVEMVLAHTFRHKVLDHCLIVVWYSWWRKRDWDESCHVLQTDRVDRGPADVLIPNWAGGRYAALDVTVINPLQAATVAGAAATPGHGGGEGRRKGEGRRGQWWRKRRPG